MPGFSWALRGDRERARSTGVVLMVAGVLLAGCGPSGDPDGSGSSNSPGSGADSPSATSQASNSASPTPTLSADEQQAFEEATAVVLAYRQTITDLYSGARTDLNDLNDVATGELLDKGLMNIQQSLGEGWSVIPSGVQVAIVSSAPLRLDLESDPNTVKLQACVDASDVTEIDPEGGQKAGVREQLDYTVVRTSYLPAPGWAVSEVSTDSENAEDRRC